MFPDDPCEVCPRVVRGLPLPCLAQKTKHARFCETIRMGQQGYAALLCRGIEDLSQTIQTQPEQPTFPLPFGQPPAEGGAEQAEKLAEMIYLRSCVHLKSCCGQYGKCLINHGDSHGNVTPIICKSCPDFKSRNQ
jgi:hypothetical protein